MDKIWNRKSFEVGGHWPLWRGWKNRMTTQNRQKSNGIKKEEQKEKCCVYTVNLQMTEINEDFKAFLYIWVIAT